MGLATAVEIGGSTVRALPVEFFGRGRACKVLAPLEDCAMSMGPKEKSLGAPALFDLVARHALAIERSAAQRCEQEGLPGSLKAMLCGEEEEGAGG